MPCVLYAHGATENKLEGLEQLELVLPLGINLCSFDFSGCGNSEGEYVTFGHKERDDLKSVIAYIVKHKRVSDVVLWGRSMGAVASIFYMAENPGIVNCAILDSGFAHFNQVFLAIASKLGIPPKTIEEVNMIEDVRPELDKAIY